LTQQGKIYFSDGSGRLIFDLKTCTILLLGRKGVNFLPSKKFMPTKVPSRLIRGPPIPA
jgi:hypothetical protein